MGWVVLKPKPNGSKFCCSGRVLTTVTTALLTFFTALTTESLELFVALAVDADTIGTRLVVGGVELAAMATDVD